MPPGADIERSWHEQHGKRGRRGAAAGPACGTGAPTLAARCGAQTFGLRGGASDLGASRLLMQDALAGARTPEVAIAGVAAFPCIYARAWMPVTRIAAWAVGVWDGRLT